MKILKNSTYREMQEKIAAWTERSQRFEADNLHLLNELSDENDKRIAAEREIADLRAKLAKYSRYRGQNGRFVSAIINNS